MPETVRTAVAREKLRRRLNEVRQTLGLGNDRATANTWWRRHRLTTEYQRFVGYEAMASRINVYQALFVPGLLQTADYARAITSAVIRRDPAHPGVTARVQVRMKRQHDFLGRLDKPNAPELVALIDEAVLRRPVGGTTVLRDQFDQLIEMARRPHISIVVMPMQIGAHPGLGGTFEMLEFPNSDALDILFVESGTCDFVLKHSAATSAIRDIVADLRAAGLNGDDAVDLIGRIRDELA
jgi:hypothetical protein